MGEEVEEFGIASYERPLYLLGLSADHPPSIAIPNLQANAAV